jgi:transcriptional regulator with XRE-family HTH domain
LGLAIKGARVAQGIKATDVAKRSGRSRDILNRLERGQDITVSSLKKPGTTPPRNSAPTDAPDTIA